MVHDGGFLGVVAEREEQAINARQALIAGASWSAEGPRLPTRAPLEQALKGFAGQDKIVSEAGQATLLRSTGGLRRATAVPILRTQTRIEIAK